MTLNQLKESVAALGFEKAIEDENALINAANRALRLIYTDRPVTRSVIISTDVPLPVSGPVSFTHRGKGTKSFSLVGKAYSFRTYGRGGYRIERDGAVTERRFDGVGTVHKGFVTGNGNITFFGDYLYTVGDLCFFDSVLSGAVEDIPVYNRTRVIDLYRMYPDFLCFDTKPTYPDGSAVEGCGMKDGRLTLPEGITGEIHLEYERAPRAITAEDGGVHIDVPEEEAELLSLLCASFMWLDDDPEKSQYYMALYKDALATIKRYSSREIDTEYSDNGWA